MTETVERSADSDEMRQDVKAHVKTCYGVCVKVGGEKYRGVMRVAYGRHVLSVEDGPNQAVCFDHANMPRTEEGYTPVLAIVDMVSGLPSISAARGEGAEETADLLLRDWIGTNGPMRRLHSDGAKSLNGEVIMAHSFFDGLWTIR